MSVVEQLERKIKEAISEFSALKMMHEIHHYETVAEALDLVLDGVNARLSELEEEYEDLEDEEDDEEC